MVSRKDIFQFKVINTDLALSRTTFSTLVNALYANELGMKTKAAAVPIVPTGATKKNWVLPAMGFVLVAHLVSVYAYKAYKSK